MAVCKAWLRACTVLFEVSAPSLVSRSTADMLTSSPSAAPLGAVEASASAARLAAVPYHSCRAWGHVSFWGLRLGRAFLCLARSLVIVLVFAMAG